MTNPYSTPGPWDLVAPGYAETTMRSLGKFSDQVLRRAQLSASNRVLDVACGPGTLALKAVFQCAHVDALDFSAEMVSLFREKLRKENIINVDIREGDGQALPYADGSFDAAFSMFGLMFFPDRVKGFKELHRTLRAGGRAWITSWAPIARSPLMQLMFGALSAMNGEAQAQNEKTATTLEDPEVFRREMEGAGFRRVEITALRAEFPFASAERFWTEMTTGSPPIVLLRKNVGEDLWQKKGKIGLRFLEEKFADRPLMLSSEAWLGTGIKE